MKRRIALFLTLILAVLYLVPVTASADMLDKYAEPAPVASSGSFEASLKTWMEFNLSGGQPTSAKWSLAYMSAGYLLYGTVKEGETISLSTTGYQSPNAENLVFNSLTMDLIFRDENNVNIGDIVKYTSGNVKASPLSHELSGVVPEGTKRVLIRGIFHCRWAGMVVVEEAVSVSVELTVEDEPEVTSPVATTRPTETKPVITVTPKPTTVRTEPTDPDEEDPLPLPVDEGPGDDVNPWQHAGAGATIVISLVSALAAIFGGAIGSATGGAAAAGLSMSPEPGPVSGEAGTAEEPDTSGGLDPAYERKNVPDYPAFVTGADGERISRMPNGNIEVSHPGGERIIHFPNGTVQVQNPDGSTWEEWPDGTVSTSDADGLVVKTPDGTMTHTKPSGEEMIYHPDGTTTETTKTGLKITRNEAGETVRAVSASGNVTVRHPEDPDAFLVTSPHGGSLKMKIDQKLVHQRNEAGELEYKTVDHVILEGEIRTEDSTLTFKPDGSAEGVGDDGSRFKKDSQGNLNVQTADGDVYEKFADGRENYQGADGTTYRSDPNTGEVEARLPDGSSIKGNNQTGEVEMTLPDGSTVKKDAQGNGSFVDTETGLRGTVQSDGFKKLETEDATLTQSADGTMDFVTKTGARVTQKPDGTVTMQLPDGRSSLDTPDGTQMTKMPDGTIFRKTADGTTQIQRPDGQVQQTSGQDYQRELNRYNDWYNQHLEQWLKNQGQGGN